MTLAFGRWANNINYLLKKQDNWQISSYSDEIGGKNTPESLFIQILISFIIDINDFLKLG